METITKIFELLEALKEQFEKAGKEIDTKETELKKQKRFEEAKVWLSRLQQMENHSSDITKILDKLKSEYKVNTEPKLKYTKTKSKRTQEADYYLPILQAFIEYKGSAPTRKIVERVGEIMKPILKPIDYERVTSIPHEIRWENAAQWARNSMVYTLGYMKKGSPRGIWEISELGMKFYRENKR
jgi:hypothetical protein